MLGHRRRHWIIVLVVLSIATLAIWMYSKRFTSFKDKETNQGDFPTGGRQVFLRETLMIIAPYLRMAGDEEMPALPHLERLEIYPSANNTLAIRFYVQSEDGLKTCDYIFKDVVCSQELQEEGAPIPQKIVFEVKDPHPSFAGLAY